MEKRAYVGRSSGFNPPNRFQEIKVELPPDDLAGYFEPVEPGRRIPTKFYVDHTRSILAKNTSPDVGFTYSLNPYRGCEHGCIYCYARPSHEYLGFSAGLDFESRIVVKFDAPKLLRETLLKKNWAVDTIHLSGDTDCYQPVERKLQLTRDCLKVFLELRHPVSIITKNGLIQRDIDILRDLASLQLVSVAISVTTLDQELARTMEPRTSSPAKRLETIELLSSHGVPVSVNVAPVIPGLNDVEIPAILKAAAERGAHGAGYLVVRLPFSVKDLFLDWLNREMPDRARKIENRIRSVREGQLSSSEFGIRMSGTGRIAETIEQLFKSSAERNNLNRTRVELRKDLFVRNSSQQNLFTSDESA